MAGSGLDGPAPPADLPPIDQLNIRVTEPTRRDDHIAYKVSLRDKNDGRELHYQWRRFREFEEAFKALQTKGKAMGVSLPDLPPKKAFGRFEPKFLEERRRLLENFMGLVKEKPGLSSGSEFQALCGLFGGGGYLRKLGARTIAFKDPFKTRWFEMDNEEASVHYHEKQGGKRLGTIDLRNTRVVDCTMYTHAICVMGPALPRTYILVADTEAEKRQWWKCFDNASGGASKEPGIGPREGVEDAGSAEQYYTKGGGSVGLKDFDLQCVVGVGSFGKVMKVKRRDTGQVYAMKVLDKDQIVQNKMIAHTKAEKQILETIDHPFICKLHFAFQTKKQLIFVLDFLSGGELFYHLQRQKRFSEQRARFYTAEIALAIGHLHTKGVIYRDLKPENLVLDHEGHITLTDFGLAKTDCKGTTYTFCGTPEYMAPELVTKQGHTNAVDWWSLGIFLYEMVVGIPPFYTQNVSQMYQLILNKPLEFPSFVSQPLRDVLRRLLDRDPKQRLCDLEQLKQQTFFAEIDFETLYRREITPEFIPSLGEGESDTKYFDAEFTKQSTELPGDDQPGQGYDDKFKDFNKS
eukprot:Hpha_TRINITY_DN16818_c0_g5::TRINITY_DN16818_c0_g5_i1::g.148344::m.148344/K13303/SGK2; serum/glucocorticoid-regulated kinase 2